MTPDPAAEVTVGVSIMLPEPHAGILQEARRRFGDQQADQVQTHVTVLAPRLLTWGEVPALEDHLALVAAERSAYRMVLHSTGTFRPVTDVVFLRVAEGAQRCIDLAEAVRAGPVAGEDRYPYHPHVTLAQEVTAAQLDQAETEMATYRLEFVVDAVTLSVCGPDGYWYPLRRFALASA